MVCSGGTQIAKIQVDLLIWILPSNIPEILGNTDRRTEHLLPVIIDWTDRDVWDYLRSEKIPVNPLYSEGIRRIGCIGCPMASGRYAQFARWPKYKDAYMRAFKKMLEVRKELGLPTTWETAEEVFRWWMEDGVLPGQLELDLDGEED